MADQINVPALESWLGRPVDGFEGLLTISRFSGGQSNPTFPVRSEWTTF